MPVLLFKSYLALALLPLCLVALYTMLEVFGREGPGPKVDTLKRIHRANGILFIIVFLVIACYCLGYVISVKAELSARAALHAALAISILILFLLKVSFVSRYRRFYPQAKALGITIAVMSLVLIGLSGGYYLVVTEFGTEAVEMRMAGAVKEGAPPVSLEVRTDSGSIARGKGLYEDKCTFCHDPYSRETLIGPGHKGILKNPGLPVSGRPAAPVNIRRQLMDPYRNMPPFDQLSEDEVADIIAFMNTL
jgi:hypothetical protein